MTLKMRRAAHSIFITILALIAACAVAHARLHHRHRTQGSHNVHLDLSPIKVEPYVLPYATDPHRANQLRRMNFENGFLVRGTRFIENHDVTNRDLFVLQITQALEGGFDSVNVYDKGVLSWGIMQWASHTDSLHQCLWYTKRKLAAEHELAVWNKTFGEAGLDVNRLNITVFGKPITDAADARRVFRGTVKPGKCDPNLVSHWASVFARAGRQPAIERAEMDFACHSVDEVMDRRINGIPYHAAGRNGLTVMDLTGNDPYSQALVFALWTNNPKHAWLYVASAARAARASSVSNDPSLWPRGSFSYALLRQCDSSSFSNWQHRAQIIEARETSMRTSMPGMLTPFEQSYQIILGKRKLREGIEIASRHMQKMRSAHSLQLLRTPTHHKHTKIAMRHDMWFLDQLPRK